jgi:transketolase
MLNPLLKLNTDCFKPDAKRLSTRKGFGEALFEVAMEDQRIVALCADVTESLSLVKFRERFPQRFIEMGVAEQNMAAVASGVAAMGKIPFIASYAVFSPGRNWEQIRTTICYNDRPVKIIGSHGGVTVGPDGGSHQALEDIAIMRVLPRMTVFAPADFNQTKNVVKQAISIESPVYIRLSRPDLPLLYTDLSPYSSTSVDVVWTQGDGVKIDCCIFAIGTCLFESISAAFELEKENIFVKVVNVHTIKPLPALEIVRLSREAGAIVTAEDHQMVGGLGSSIAESLSRTAPVIQEYVGISDQFGQSGTPAELSELYKIDKKGIKEAVKRAIKRKQAS